MSVFTKCYYNDKMGVLILLSFFKAGVSRGFNQEDVIYFNFYTSLSFSSYNFWCAYSKKYLTFAHCLIKTTIRMALACKWP